MLPFSARDTLQSPLNSRMSFAVGRPGWRWISWVLVCIGFLWICGALFVNFAPTPLHGYVPAVDSLLRGARPQHPSYYTPSTPALPYPPPPPFHDSMAARAERVREAFIHAYSGYKNHSFPFDELLPIDGGKVNK
jgi:mannosyl-oligosaccharide alpha-1,2-mannosidase